MNLCLPVFSVCVAFTQAVSYEALIQEQWENFKLEHGKIYQSEDEEQYRQRVFMDNLHTINQHNKLYEMDLKSYKMAMNHFGDLPDEEFFRLYTMQNLSFSLDSADNLPQSMKDFVIFAPPSNINVTDLPKDVDWRTSGAVTSVKNQRACQSCWSFSATGVLEGQWFRKTNRLISLSEQNIMDCSWKYGNNACNRGWTSRGLTYVKDNGGIESEASYPYKARSNRKCKYDSGESVATVSQVIMIPTGEGQLLAKVASVGPIAVNIETSYGFRFYRKGVYDEPRCGDNTDHAVLVVGYGTQKGNDYWLVKNSWGARWGERGYILMSRNKNDQCGIATQGCYPIV